MVLDTVWTHATSCAQTTSVGDSSRGVYHTQLAASFQTVCAGSQDATKSKNERVETILCKGSKRTSMERVPCPRWRVPRAMCYASR